MISVRLKSVFLFFLAVVFFTSLLYYPQQMKKINQSITKQDWQAKVLLEKINYTEKKIRDVLTEGSIANKIVFSGREEDFILLFDFIDDRYKVKTYNFKIQKSEAVDIHNKYGNYVVVKTEITANFKSKTQVNLMMFLKYIFDKIPGYSYLKTLEFEESIEDIDGFFAIQVYTLKIRHC